MYLFVVSRIHCTSRSFVYHLFRYEQVDACVATFPKPGNGPVNDPSIQARLKGLKWLATQGKRLPPGVERVLGRDAKDLKDLPMSNDAAANLLPGVDIEEVLSGEGRKPSRVLLRHGDNAMAIAVAKAAAKVSKHQGFGEYISVYSGALY
jgi:hypothetical protein